MATIKAVLFDLGGTLLHYHDPAAGDPSRPFRRVTQAGIRAVCERLDGKGYLARRPGDPQEVMDRHIGPTYRALMQELKGGSVETPIRAALSELGADLDEVQWAALRPLFYHAVDDIVFVREGAQPTLAALQGAGYKLGLISNTFWAADLHDRHLAEHDLLDFFPVRVYSCDTPRVKPHPSVFTSTLARLGVEPDGAVYVGDRPDVDVTGAQGVGMRGVLIRSPYISGDFADIVPDAVIDELPDLIPVLERWRV
jgi:putative hydrolase of the HAD superfamily